MAFPLRRIFGEQILIPMHNLESHLSASLSHTFLKVLWACVIWCYMAAAFTYPLIFGPLAHTLRQHVLDRAVTTEVACGRWFGKVFGSYYTAIYKGISSQGLFYNLQNKT